MNKFNPDAVCPKCGYDKVRMTWRKKGTVWADGYPIDKPERIERECGQCRYSWDELPLDKEQP